MTNHVCNNFSIVRLEEGLTNHVCNNGNELSDSSIDSNQLAYKKNWMDGILGCLRPVWGIIGKSAISEKHGLSE